MEHPVSDRIDELLETIPFEGSGPMAMDRFVLAIAEQHASARLRWTRISRCRPITACWYLSNLLANRLVEKIGFFGVEASKHHSLANRHVTGDKQREAAAWLNTTSLNAAHLLRSGTSS